MKTKILSIMLGILLVANLFLVSAITIKDVSSSPDEVEPGEVFDISIEIENVYEFDTENINLRLDLSNVPFAPFQSSSEEFLDKLDEGDEEDFEFKLIALPEAESGIYKIPVEITYEDEDGKNLSKSELISVIVNSAPELKVSLEDSVIFIKGQENIFSIRIVNSGLADVKFVYLKASEVNGVDFISETEQYIGDIDSDDFDSVEYQIRIDRNLGSDKIRIPIILKFKDSTNKEFTETKNIEFNVYTLKEAQEKGLVAKPTYTLYLIVGVVVIGFFGYRFYKKRKLKKIRGR